MSELGVAMEPVTTRDYAGYEERATIILLCHTPHAQLLLVWDGSKQDSCQTFSSVSSFP